MSVNNFKKFWEHFLRYRKWAWENLDLVFFSVKTLGTNVLRTEYWEFLTIVLQVEVIEIKNLSFRYFYQWTVYNFELSNLRKFKKHFVRMIINTKYFLLLPFFPFTSLIWSTILLIALFFISLLYQAF